jgi:hypothetical protein
MGYTILLYVHLKRMKYEIVLSNADIEMSSEVNSISQLKKLLDVGCKIEKIQPPVMASDAEVNIAIVTVACPDGANQTIKAYREEAVALREFIRANIYNSYK